MVFEKNFEADVLGSITVEASPITTGAGGTSRFTAQAFSSPQQDAAEVFSKMATNGSIYRIFFIPNYIKFFPPLLVLFFLTLHFFPPKSDLARIFGGGTREIRIRFKFSRL